MNATTVSTEGGPLHARFDGPIVMIGFGSIGKGTLPLIERHIAFDRAKFVVIAPDDSDRRLLDERQIRFMHLAVTKENYRELLTPLLTAGPGRALVVNLSVDTSSVALMELAKDLDAFYIDTVVEPWPGLYTDRSLSPSARSNYALREAARLRHDAVLLVGDAPYYSRFGFSSEKTSALWLPGPYERHRLLGCELKPGALDGARGLISARSPLEQRPELATLVAGLVRSDNSLAPHAA